MKHPLNIALEEYLEQLEQTIDTLNEIAEVNLQQGFPNTNGKNITRIEIIEEVISDIKKILQRYA